MVFSYGHLSHLSFEWLMKDFSGGSPMTQESSMVDPSLAKGPFSLKFPLANHGIFCRNSWERSESFLILFVGTSN